MLRNLSAEMARYGVTVNDIKFIIGKSERTTREKIKGRSDFSVPEAVKIKNACFPDLTLEYLFAPQPPIPTTHAS